jgi:phytoene dehydrogenase-like protein
MNGSRTDAVLVGAGHNGLVAAILLAKAGLSVTVVEDKGSVGGATKTERPFAKAPGLAASTGAYLLGLMPPELLTKLGVTLPTLRRDPHYFLPTTGKAFLLFGSDRDEMGRQFGRYFSEADWRANEALEAEIAKIRDDVAPSWLAEPKSLEETAEEYVRQDLRRVYVDLCRGSVGEYLERFGFQSDLVAAMHAVTDGFSGLRGSWGTKGTGHNFLVHKMCRLPGSDGTFMIVRGGMGTVAETLATRARELGVTIRTGVAVERVKVDGSVARGVLLADGTELTAEVVVVNADPFRLRRLVGQEKLPEDYNRRLDGYARDGTTLKLNMCLSRLPRFTCLPEDRGQHGATIHLLPQGEDVVASLEEAFEAVKAGRLAEFPSIEWYIHTTVDPSMQDGEGRHASALFVQWVPYSIAESSWEAEEKGYVDHLLSICDRFAPGTSDLVVDTFPLPPPKIEDHFGISRGHIHHVDNSFATIDRLPYSVPIQGLYACSAGCHPAGAVIGAAGHNAAMRVLRDMGRM